MTNRNFEILPGGQDPSRESAKQQAARIRGNKVTEQRILSDAELIKRGARIGERGDLELQDEQILDLGARVEQAEKTIRLLERPEIAEGLASLREKGKTLAPAMRELFLVTRDLTMSRRVMAEAFSRGESVVAYEDEFRTLETRSAASSKQVEAFFVEVRQFAEQYGLDDLGGVSLDGGIERSKSALVEEIAEHFQSPTSLIDAIEQVRDAKLYRAYREKKEVTGRM